MASEKKMKPWMKWTIGAIAAVILLAVGGIGGAMIFGGDPAADISTISLEVNPRIEIKIDGQEKILEVTGKNEEGKTVIGDMDFTGSSLDIAINALIGSMHKHGYLNENANSILISVDSGNPAKAAELQTKLTTEVNEAMGADDFDGSVITQTLSENGQLQKLAESYGITLGKAQLIQKILEENTGYTFEDLVPLSINELNLLIKEGGAALDNVQVTGTASEEAYIGEAKAKSIALSHAGLQEEDITFTKIKLEYHDKRAEYEIEFYKGIVEYDYEIDALSGEIISYGQDGGNYTPPAATPKPSSLDSSAGYIGEAKAKSIALSHAGVKATDARFTKVKLDKDDGRAEYEIEFYKGNTEYDYEIDALSGEIISYGQDGANYTPPAATPKPSSSNSSAGYIGEAKAKSIALSHAGVKATDARFTKVKLDKDDGRAEYEIEFYKGNTEYDYEIDALSGAIISYDQDAESYTPPAKTPKPSSSSSSGSTNYIGTTKAKSIALAHAGVKASDVQFTKAKLEYDDGRAEYEIEFYKGSAEYDYEIDAVSGAILSYDKDAESYTPPAKTPKPSSSSSSGSTNYIGAAKAKSIALANAKVSSSQAREMECSLDKDGGTVVYEVEFKAGSYEYSYEINAVTGKIVSKEREKDD